MLACCLGLNVLTHWGQVTHICVSKLTTISSDNGLLPGRGPAIIWTNAGILLIGLLGTSGSDMLIKIQTFSLKKIRLKMLFAKCCPNVVSACWCPGFCHWQAISRAVVLQYEMEIFMKCWCFLLICFSIEKLCKIQMHIYISTRKQVLWCMWYLLSIPMYSLLLLSVSVVLCCTLCFCCFV